MVEIIRIILILLLASSPVLLAAAILFVRDRLTFPRGISKEERNRITQERSARALRRWNIIRLFCACASLPFSLADIAHQQARYRAAEAVVAIFFIFRYYQKRSEIGLDDTATLAYPPAQPMSSGDHDFQAGS